MFHPSASPLTRREWNINAWHKTVSAFIMTRSSMRRWIFCTLPGCVFRDVCKFHAHAHPIATNAQKHRKYNVGSGFSPALR
mmetsp:Transcript_41572/g.99464  ORF Transcript_41572/g.99464 Transcript_41572/m.99464 type:complete len:81 (-) Transcript_41572:553-795(-)